MSYLNKNLYDWTISDVCCWMHQKNLRKYIKNFENNKITGYDLCFISNEELKNELGIGTLHERLLLMKEFKKLILDNLKLNIVYENATFQIAMDFDNTFTLGGLVPYIENIIRIPKVYDLSSTIVIMDTFQKEILSPNCKIIELMLLDPNKYKTLHVTSNSSHLLNRDGVLSSSNNQKSKFTNVNDITTKESNIHNEDDTGKFYYNKEDKNSQKKVQPSFENDLQKPSMAMNYCEYSIMNRNIYPNKQTYSSVENERNEGRHYITGERNNSGVYLNQFTSTYNKYPNQISDNPNYAKKIKRQYSPIPSPSTNFTQRNSNPKSVERVKMLINRNNNDQNNSSMNKTNLNVVFRNQRKFHEDTLESDPNQTRSCKNIRVNTPPTRKVKFETDSSYMEKRYGK